MKQIYILLVACICMLTCQPKPQQPTVIEVEQYDLPQLKDSGVLVALTLNSSISYFDYRGEPMGFQYELAKQFAESLGLKLEMKTARSTQELVDMLLKGEGDLIAYPLPITKAFKDTVTFCGEDIVTHQVLVQRNSTKEQKALTAAVLKNRNAGGTLQDGGRMRLAAMMPLWLIACVTGVFLLRFGFRKLRFLSKRLRARIREELQGQYASKVSLRAMPHILLFVLLCAIWLCAGWLLLRLIVMPFYTFTDWIPESPADPASILSCIRNLMITAASSAAYKSRAASATETASALIRAGCLVCMIGLVPFRRSVRPPE